MSIDVDRGMECFYHQQLISVYAEAGAATAGSEASGGDKTERKDDGVDGRREWIELGEVQERRSARWTSTS